MCLHFALTLLLACTALTWEADSPGHVHSDFQRSTLQERDLGVSSGSLPDLNSTDALCLLLALPAIGSRFSEECGVAVAQVGSSDPASIEEENALKDACTADCAGKLVQFIKEECQDVIAADSVLTLCAEFNGVPCHYLSALYDWTTVHTNCIPNNECSEKCSESVSNAFEAVGCCANYDHHLVIQSRTCSLNLPEECPYPFEEDSKDQEEDGADKKGDKIGDSDDKERTTKPHNDPISGSETIAPVYTSVFSFSILYCMYFSW